ncbi:GIY-YIG nuclease family protein [Zoogloea sp.]|uniref:GIY-YIG nuclease family protein n=1 Tax=Zoogloea sp. TaxID=49181 RepID=UPI0035B3CDB6
MSTDTSYYVYALKDPRQSPALPFYIGKGSGTRAHDHLVNPDDSPKGRRIREIEAAGAKVLVVRLVDALTEAQALRIEAELIAAFGTIETGGSLTNAVMPSGLARKARAAVVVPSGVREKAQIGLALLKDAVLELAKANPQGISNSDAASLLGLRSDYGGGSKDYLSYSVIGLLMRDGKLARTVTGRKHIAKVD